MGYRGAEASDHKKRREANVSNTTTKRLVDPGPEGGGGPPAAPMIAPVSTVGDVSVHDPEAFPPPPSVEESCPSRPSPLQRPISRSPHRRSRGSLSRSPSGSPRRWSLPTRPPPPASSSRSSRRHHPPEALGIGSEGSTSPVFNSVSPSRSTASPRPSPTSTSHLSSSGGGGGGGNGSGGHDRSSTSSGSAEKRWRRTSRGLTGCGLGAGTGAGAGAGLERIETPMSKPHYKSYEQHPPVSGSGGRSGPDSAVSLSRWGWAGGSRSKSEGKLDLTDNLSVVSLSPLTPLRGLAGLGLSPTLSPASHPTPPATAEPRVR
ncbi:unnamed protein product, partial [Discosporangium mesarthrocarpum]